MFAETLSGMTGECSVGMWENIKEDVNEADPNENYKQSLLDNI